MSEIVTDKSIYFTTRPVFSKSRSISYWPLYSSGIFDGKFQEEVGQGAFGTVISGEWEGKNAAFKFVEIKSAGEIVSTRIFGELPKVLNESLDEIKSMLTTKGSRILRYYGHYR